ncbi:MAG: RNA polymerase sigma factor [Fimbriiglobus sp.]
MNPNKKIEPKTIAATLESYRHVTFEQKRCLDAFATAIYPLITTLAHKKLSKSKDLHELTGNVIGATWERIQKALLKPKVLASVQGYEGCEKLVRRHLKWVILDLIRRKKDILPLPLDDRSPPDTSPQPQVLAETNEYNKHLEVGLGKLEQIHREVLILKYTDGLKNCDIAVRLGVNESTIRYRLHNARMALMEVMGIQPSDS